MSLLFDPEFLEWERDQVSDSPMYSWDHNGLRYHRYRFESPGPIFSLKSVDVATSAADAMRAKYSEVKTWRQGDVL